MARTVVHLEASVDIDATPDRVWAVVSDLRQMTEWSPEVIFQGFSSRVLRVGTRSINLNKRKGFVWPTSSKITAFEPDRRLSFYVHGPSAQWTYELEATATGTRLTERRELKRGRPSALSKSIAAVALGGFERHDTELLAGAHTTLAHIKAAAEHPR